MLLNTMRKTTFNALNVTSHLMLYKALKVKVVTLFDVAENDAKSKDNYHYLQNSD